MLTMLYASVISVNSIPLFVMVKVSEPLCTVLWSFVVCLLILCDTDADIFPHQTLLGDSGSEFLQKLFCASKLVPILFWCIVSIFKWVLLVYFTTFGAIYILLSHLHSLLKCLHTCCRYLHMLIVMIRAWFMGPYWYKVYCVIMLHVKCSTSNVSYCPLYKAALILMVAYCIVWG